MEKKEIKEKIEILENDLRKLQVLKIDPRDKFIRSLVSQFFELNNIISHNCSKKQWLEFSNARAYFLEGCLAETFFYMEKFNNIF